MKKVSRFWARTSITLTVGGCLLIFLGAGWRFAWVIILGGLMVLAALLIKFCFLRCPQCGWGGQNPRWSKKRSLHCVKCGAEIEYDR